MFLTVDVYAPAVRKKDQRSCKKGLMWWRLLNLLRSVNRSIALHCELFFYTGFVMLHTWICAHVRRFNSVSSDRVRDGSSELRCLGSPCLRVAHEHTYHAYINATCKLDISARSDGTSLKLGTNIHHAVKVLKVRGQRPRSHQINVEAYISTMWRLGSLSFCFYSFSKDVLLSRRCRLLIAR